MKLFHFVLVFLVLLRSSGFACAQVLPIKPTRIVSFTTSEGTEMDVGVSPDGKTLIFNLLGDLYTVPVQGGSATQITRGLAFNEEPLWSPNGKEIAYISDISGSWSVNVRDEVGGSHVVLGEIPLRFDSSLGVWLESSYDSWMPMIWSPGGDHIGITYRNRYFDCKVSNGEVNQRPSPQPLLFSKDGDSSYFVEDKKGLCRHGEADGLTTVLVPTSALPKGIEAMSPDGRWLACIQHPAPAGSDSASAGYSTRLVVHEIATGVERTLVPALSNNKNTQLPRGFAFSPDSKTIFIAYGGTIHQVGIEDGSDRVVPFKANVQVDLGPLDYNRYSLAGDCFKVRHTRSANASPDGRHVVFCALDRLYVVNVPNGKPTVLAPQSIGQFQPVYSPDGLWIAYVTWSDVEGGALWRVPATGGEPQKLTREPGQYQRPAWSPDGAWIAVVKGPLKWGDRDYEGEGRLELISTQEAPPRTIEDSVPLNNSLAFSQDGQRIIYMPSERAKVTVPFLVHSDVSARLVSETLDGNDPRVLATGDRDPEEVAMSPDGRFFAYTKAEDVYLVPADGGGRPTTIYDPNHQRPTVRFSKGVDPHWEEGGNILAWSYGADFYRAKPEEIVALASSKSGRSLTAP